MDRSEAARVMGMKPSEVVGVEETPDGLVATTHDGVRTLLTRTVRLTRKPEPEPASAPEGDDVPDGAAKDVLAWVGDDPERALRAFEVEHAKESPRKVLLATLEKLVG